jgi:hypothetical protein
VLSGFAILILSAGAGQSQTVTPDAGGPTPQAPSPTAVAAQGEIDFARDVQPLLARRCLRCHDERERMGGLSLVSRAHAEVGGDSMKNPLVAGPENELLRRVRSTNEMERMPLEGPPLSAAEIDLLDRWIALGAPWPEAPSPTARPLPQQPKTLIELAGSWVDLWDKSKLDRLRPAAYALIGVLLVMLILERLKTHFAAADRQAASDESASGGFFRRVARTPRIAYAALVLAVAAGGMAVYARGLSTDLEDAQQKLSDTQKLLQETQLQAATRSSYADNEIYWPKHPPRLGGLYYRGNDERSERLFNGGVYLTATLQLELRDASDRVLEWGDQAEGPLIVRLEIRKAPHATAALFGQETLGQVCLSPIPPPVKATDPGEPPADAQPAPPAVVQAPPVQAGPVEPGPTAGGPFLLQPLLPGESWEARAELPPIPPGKTMVGMLYVYTGLKQTADDGVDRPHYAIEYRLQLDQAGRLTDESTLRLGSMYNVTVVMEIPPDRIAPSEWFDYRPLPAIEGEPTIDPKLLGTEEHLKKAAD